MFCSNCGKEIPSGAAFCPNCGAKALSAPEPSNLTSTPPADSAGNASAEPQPPKISPASTSPLEAVIGQNAAYYMAEFQKIDAGQKPRFNWVALFFGPYLCFYRRCPALFKQYFLLSYILLFAAALVAAVSLALLNLTVLLACGVVILAAGVLTLVNSIRLGRNFNREYYRRCQQQLALLSGTLPSLWNSFTADVKHPICQSNDLVDGVSLNRTVETCRQARPAPEQFAAG